MSRKTGGMTLLVLGLVVAVGVAFLVFSQAQRAAQTARMESVDVLVAAQDIPERTVLAPPFIAVKRMLPASLPPNAVVRPDDVLGKMTTGPILAGEFILPGKLVGTDGRAGLTYTVPKGKVVMTMPASDILTTGAIRAGDTVDLLVTIMPPDQRGTSQAAATPRDPQAQTRDPQSSATATATPVSDDVLTGTTQTTMQNLKVLSIGQVMTGAPVEQGKDKADTASAQMGGSIITFAVDHQDALILKALKDSDRVKLELVLRAAGDNQVARTDPVTLGVIVERYSFRAVPTPRSTPAAGR